MSSIVNVCKNQRQLSQALKYHQWDSNPHEHYCPTEFPATLCYHSQTVLVLQLRVNGHFNPCSHRITTVFTVCCSLEYIITILKFLQDNHMSLFLVLQLNGNPYSYLHIIKFQLRYLLYILYTFIKALWSQI